MPNPTSEQDFWNQTVALLEKMAADLEDLVKVKTISDEYRPDTRWTRQRPTR